MHGSSNIKHLIHRIARDDEKAFVEFYELYYNTIYRFTSYFISNAELIQEIVSDVFFNVWKSRKNLLNVENIEAYLYSSTRNRALYYIKQKNFGTKNIEINEIPYSVHIDDQTPEYIALNKELEVKIQHSISSLPDKCRIIFLMAREEGLKYKEIARILSISEKTVNAQMVIALKKLVKIINEYLAVVLF